MGSADTSSGHPSMKAAPGFGLTRYLAPLAGVRVVLSGCASSHKLPPASQGFQPTPTTPPTPPPTRAEPMPPGRTHGMPSISAVPDPAWYAERFNRARGVGEAMSRDHVTQWDKESMAYSYYVGGVLYAHYQPYEHRLSIRTDNLGDPEPVSEWDADGALATPTAGREEPCRQLLGALDRHVAVTGHFPPIDANTSAR